MKRRRWSLVLALSLVAVAGASLYRAWLGLGRHAEVAELCEAVRAGDWSHALALPAAPAQADADGRLAAECRCYALIAARRDSECVALLEAMLADPAAGDWMPEASLARLLIRTRLESVGPARASDLARRAVVAHPDDLDLLQVEVIVRSAAEGEEPVLAELEGRLARARDSLPLRLVVAGAYQRRGDARAALRALGEQAPGVGTRHEGLWYEARAQAFAALGRLDGVQRTYQTWRQAGGDPDEISARYAIRLSVSQLPEPDRSWIQLLREALVPGLRPEIRQLLYDRLIGHLLVTGLTEEALATYDRAVQEVSLPSISREEIERSARLEDQRRGGEPLARGTLVFRLPAGASEGELWVSPDPTQPPDAAFSRLPLRGGGSVRLERTLGPWPSRWVLRDGEGWPRASGSVWPVAGGEVEVAIEPRPPPALPVFEPPRVVSADGRRRVFVVVLDAADWRLVQYLRARGELPLLDHLLRTGYRAVLDSWPPLTATAMESLVWPTRGHQITFLGLVHHLGVELAGLASVGRNPIGFLEAALPAGESLVETVGARDLVVANMLFSHGMIDAGRHAELVGPRGARRPARPLQAFRSLTAEERTRFPQLLAVTHREFRPLVETVAAELDAAVSLAREDDVDLLLLRVEPLDILTHSLFHELTRTRQDDGDTPLLWAYRYIDYRLEELRGALDADDVLVVMSDHGIRTAMEHERDALFVAVGEGLPHLRVPGRPDLRGVPRTLASLLAIETRWPETGLGHALEGRSREQLARRAAGLVARSSARRPGTPGSSH